MGMFDFLHHRVVVVVTLSKSVPNDCPVGFLPLEGCISFAFARRFLDAGRLPSSSLEGMPHASSRASLLCFSSSSFLLCLFLLLFFVFLQIRGILLSLENTGFELQTLRETKKADDFLCGLVHTSL